MPRLLNRAKHLQFVSALLMTVPITVMLVITSDNFDETELAALAVHFLVVAVSHIAYYFEWLHIFYREKNRGSDD